MASVQSTPKTGSVSASTKSDPSLTVEVITYDTYKSAAKCLLNAFVDDTLDKYLFNHIKDHRQRHKAELALYEAYLYSHILRGGLCLGTRKNSTSSSSSSSSDASDSEVSDFSCVSIWAPPDLIIEDGYLTLIRSGYLRVAWLSGFEGFKKIFTQLFNVLSNTKDRVLGDDNKYTWSLIYIGTDVDSRGKGYAKHLINYMFKHYIDNNNYLTYLESSATSNIPIYKKFGFEHITDVYVYNHNSDLSLERINNTNSKVINGKLGVNYGRLDIMVRGSNKGKTPWKKGEIFKIHNDTN
ncbi:GNAT family N-acetyltransferase ASCRUDRAFT_91831 [Ascoidea rubescens DSM 1968]|uniref:N-acetyltransferase domain-containing protein n=1 Tax=Ascoidea rubescens DSM 1968 TaxID=1344418 RepID=A0A1D2VGA7_9ASCO|nr:hypothetical protein ASCRUDRAFT_91831 [Ascoidea rubescens DSM 1968]ODV60533.1 hypothetical protein ASCRUDRAFT_91831 [Ascoidea rubescens DSM 1968]